MHSKNTKKAREQWLYCCSPSQSQCIIQCSLHSKFKTTPFERNSLQIDDHATKVNWRTRLQININQINLAKKTLKPTKTIQTFRQSQGTLIYMLFDLFCRAVSLTSVPHLLIVIFTQSPKAAKYSQLLPIKKNEYKEF